MIVSMIGTIAMVNDPRNTFHTVSHHLPEMIFLDANGASKYFALSRKKAGTKKVNTEVKIHTTNQITPTTMRNAIIPTIAYTTNANS